MPRCAAVGLKDNFFDIVAITSRHWRRMSATTRALELTPQDLVRPSERVSLAATLVARYAEGGLATVPTGDDVTHPVPPKDGPLPRDGLREPDRWRVPLLLAIGPRQCGRRRSVLTAVTNHHDALRLEVVERAGTWSNARPGEGVRRRGLSRSLGVGLARERSGARSSADIIAEDICGRDLSSQPLRATYISDFQGIPALPGDLRLGAGGRRYFA